jgi:ADP-ribosylglycohydrolase
MTVSNTLSHHSFLTDPHQAAHEVWEKSGRYLAANGAIMRTAILGVLEFNRLERVMENTREICLTTHADPRCLASCVAVTTAIALMLQGKYNPHQPKELEQLVTDTLTYGQEKLTHKDQKKEFEKHIRAKKAERLGPRERSYNGLHVQGSRSWFLWTEDCL